MSPDTADMIDRPPSDLVHDLTAKGLATLKAEHARDVQIAASHRDPLVRMWLIERADAARLARVPGIVVAPTSATPETRVGTIEPKA